MSVTDPSADPVQPDEGQGTDGTSEAPYAEYLNRIPEEVRGDVEPVFQEWDANVTKRFQEASEYRKSWEPYEQAGLNRYDPQVLAQGAQFLDAVQNNPAGVWEWAQQYAAQNGLTQQQALDQLQQQEYQDPYQDPQLLEQMLQQRLSPFEQQLQQVTQHLAQQDQQQRFQEAQRFVHSQVDELKGKHEDAFKAPYTEQLLETYIGRYLDDPEHAVARAWSDVEAVVNQISRSTLQSKVDQPAGAEAGGATVAAGDAGPTKLSDAGQMARNMLAEMNRQ